MQWPASYLFKFIVPTEQKAAFLKLFPLDQSSWTFRASENGRYESISFSLLMSDAESILQIYDKAKSIPGLIAL